MKLVSKGDALQQKRLPNLHLSGVEFGEVLVSINSAVLHNVDVMTARTEQAELAGAKTIVYIPQIICIWIRRQEPPQRERRPGEAIGHLGRTRGDEHGMLCGSSRQDESCCRRGNKRLTSRVWVHHANI